MIFTVKLKKYITGASIFDIIMSELYYKKKSCLIILFKIDKSLKVSFHCTVLPLSLAIYLKIKGD